MLFIDNTVVGEVLGMREVVRVLEDAYCDLATGEAVCAIRNDLRIPTGRAAEVYQWGSMEGGSASTGYFAIRMKSDVLTEVDHEGSRTQEKHCVQPGTFCGLVFLLSSRTGEPLAIINDGVLQHMRVGADSAIGVKYAAREDAEVLGMLGSGGMARSHVEAIRTVRDIKRVQVYSPTRANRERYADELAERHGIEAVAVAEPAAVYRGADIVSGCTDATGDVIRGEWLEPGTHVTCIGGHPDQRTRHRVDTWLRLGDAPPPVDHPDRRLADENLAYVARPGDPIWSEHHMGHTVRRPPSPGEGPEVISFADVVAGAASARRGPSDITYSERGNVQGVQFYAVGGLVYELALERGLGHTVPTEWFLQDVRD